RRAPLGRCRSRRLPGRVRAHEAAAPRGGHAVLRGPREPFVLQRPQRGAGGRRHPGVAGPRGSRVGVRRRAGGLPPPGGRRRGGARPAVGWSAGPRADLPRPVPVPRRAAGLLLDSPPLLGPRRRGRPGRGGAVRGRPLAAVLALLLLVALGAQTRRGWAQVRSTSLVGAVKSQMAALAPLGRVPGPLLRAAERALVDARRLAPAAIEPRAFRGDLQLL